MPSPDHATPRNHSANAPRAGVVPEFQDRPGQSEAVAAKLAELMEMMRAMSARPEPAPVATRVAEKAAVPPAAAPARGTDDARFNELLDKYLGALPPQYPASAPVESNNSRFEELAELFKAKLAPPPPLPSFSTRARPVARMDADCGYAPPIAPAMVDGGDAAEAMRKVSYTRNAAQLAEAELIELTNRRAVETAASEATAALAATRPKIPTARAVDPQPETTSVPPSSATAQLRRLFEASIRRSNASRLSAPTEPVAPAAAQDRPSFFAPRRAPPPGNDASNDAAGAEDATSRTGEERAPPSAARGNLQARLPVPDFTGLIAASAGGAVEGRPRKFAPAQGLAASLVALMLGCGWLVTAWKNDTRPLVAAMDDLRARMNVVEATREDVAAMRAGFNGVRSTLDDAQASTSTAMVYLNARFDKLDRAASVQERESFRAVDAGKPLSKPVDRRAVSSIPAQAAFSQGGPSSLAAAARLVPAQPAASTQAASAKSQKPNGEAVGYVVREAYNGLANVESRDGNRWVAVGDTLEGAGKVRAIELRGRQWVVVTQSGIIKSETK